MLTTGPKWISRHDGSRRICQLCKIDLSLTGRYTGRFLKYLQDTTKSACIQFMHTAQYILEIQRGRDLTHMSYLSTDQQIDGFTFMGTLIKELRETITNIGDRAKCTRLKEELENLEVRMIPNR